MHTPAGFEPGYALPAVLPGNAIAFAWRGDKLLVSGRYDKSSVAPATLPCIDTLVRLGLHGSPHFMGTYDGTPCIAIVLQAEAAEPEGWHFSGLRALFPRLPDHLVALAGRAFQIVEWDRNHRFCGRCGTPAHDNDGERAKRCPACGLVSYPRVSPAMMVLVNRGNELLLAHAQRFAPGMYSALAGFVEPGETIEDCVRREVREEVNVEIGPPVYFASQSWPFPHSLMIAFNAEYAGGDMRPSDPEIEDAKWFPIDNLPALPTPVSIARRLIEATVAKLRAR
jgi:NAD+ diphosphatase